jgi:hypothetical protein
MVRIGKVALFIATIYTCRHLEMQLPVLRSESEKPLPTERLQSAISSYVLQKDSRQAPTANSSVKKRSVTLTNATTTVGKETFHRPQ